MCRDSLKPIALREREAAEMLGVSVKTLRNWRYMTPIRGRTRRAWVVRSSTPWPRLSAT